MKYYCDKCIYKYRDYTKSLAEIFGVNKAPFKKNVTCYSCGIKGDENEGFWEHPGIDILMKKTSKIPNNPNPPPPLEKSNTIIRNCGNCGDFHTNCFGLITDKECQDWICEQSPGLQKVKYSIDQFSNFLCYLTDECEGDKISREYLQKALKVFHKSKYFDLVDVIKGTSVGPTEVLPGRSILKFATDCFEELKKIHPPEFFLKDGDSDKFKKLYNNHSNVPNNPTPPPIPPPRKNKHVDIEKRVLDLKVEASINGLDPNICLMGIEEFAELKMFLLASFRIDNNSIISLDKFLGLKIIAVKQHHFLKVFEWFYKS